MFQDFLRGKIVFAETESEKYLLSKLLLAIIQLIQHSRNQNEISF